MKCYLRPTGKGSRTDLAKKVFTWNVPSGPPRRSARGGTPGNDKFGGDNFNSTGLPASRNITLTTSLPKQNPKIVQEGLSRKENSRKPPDNFGQGKKLQTSKGNLNRANLWQIRILACNIMNRARSSQASTEVTDEKKEAYEKN